MSLHRLAGLFGAPRTGLLLAGFVCLGMFLPEKLRGQASYTRPPVIDRLQAYRELVRTDPDNELVEVSTLFSTIEYDLRYATANNFTGQALYPASTRTCYLRKPAAESLARVAVSLKQKGLGIKIFDAYRPYSVTETFWKLIGDERYVAHPAKGSGHNRGIAVDLTIIDLRSGNELEMGTGFDNFSDSAHHTFTNLDQQVLLNRKLLREEMIKEGFVPLETEWWHYALPNGSRYPLLNIPFKKLK